MKIAQVVLCMVYVPNIVLPVVIGTCTPVHSTSLGSGSHSPKGVNDDSRSRSCMFEYNNLSKYKINLV